MHYHIKKDIPMVEVSSATLSGEALNWAVAMLKDIPLEWIDNYDCWGIIDPEDDVALESMPIFTEGHRGVMLMTEQLIGTTPHYDEKGVLLGWQARWRTSSLVAEGQTPLEAACRVYVLKVAGPTIRIPEMFVR